MQLSKKDLKNLIRHRLLEVIQEYQKAGPSYFSAATKRPAMDIDPFPEKQENDIDNNDGGATEDKNAIEQNPDILDDHRFVSLAKSQAQKEDSDWRDVMLEFDDMLQEFLEQGGADDPVEFYQFLQDKLSEEDMQGKTPPPTQNVARADANNSIASPSTMAAYNKRAMESYEPTLKTPTNAPAEPDDKLLLGDKDSSYANHFKDMVNGWYNSKDVEEELDDPMEPKGNKKELSDKDRQHQMMKRRAKLAPTVDPQSIISWDDLTDVISVSGAHPETLKGGDINTAKAHLLDKLSQHEIHPDSEKRFNQAIDRAKSVEQLYMTLFNFKRAFETPGEKLSPLDIKRG